MALIYTCDIKVFTYFRQNVIDNGSTYEEKIMFSHPYQSSTVSLDSFSLPVFIGHCF